MKKVVIKSLLALSVLSLNADAKMSAEQVVNKIKELGAQQKISPNDLQKSPNILAQEITLNLDEADKSYLYELAKGLSTARSDSEKKLQEYYRMMPSIQSWVESLNPFGNGQIGSMPSSQANPFA